MGLFFKIRKEGGFLDIEKLKQGELLREIEKLRCEAQDNGNINWDRDFSYFCDFIKETLCNQSIYSSLDKAKFEL